MATSSSKVGIFRRLGVGPLALVVPLCAVLLAGVFYGGCVEDLFRHEENTAGALKVVDEFMQRMSKKQPDVAAFLFSDDQSRTSVESQLRLMDDGVNYRHFDGYQRAEMTGSRFERIAEGLLWSRYRLLVEGKLNYADGSVGQFDAAFTFENGDWMIQGIHVNVPPSKTAADTSAP